MDALPILLMETSVLKSLFCQTLVPLLRFSFYVIVHNSINVEYNISFLDRFVDFSNRIIMSASGPNIQLELRLAEMARNRFTIFKTKFS